MWKEVLQLREISTCKSSCILPGFGDKRHYQVVAWRQRYYQVAHLEAQRRNQGWCWAVIWEEHGQWFLRCQKHREAGHSEQIRYGRNAGTIHPEAQPSSCEPVKPDKECASKIRCWDRHGVDIPIPKGWAGNDSSEQIQNLKTSE